MLKFPLLLYSEKGKDISTLFLYQFCKNYEKYSKNLKTLNFTERSTANKIGTIDLPNEYE